MCVAWLIHTCDLTHSYVWDDSFICVIWLIRACDMTHSYVWHDSFICVPWIVHVCGTPHSYVWHESFICVAWLIHICGMTHSYVCFIHIYGMTHAYVWHDPFMCATWLIHVWPDALPWYMTHSKTSTSIHDAFDDVPFAAYTTHSMTYASMIYVAFGDIDVRYMTKSMTSTSPHTRRIWWHTLPWYMTHSKTFMSNTWRIRLHPLRHHSPSFSSRKKTYIYINRPFTETYKTDLKCTIESYSTIEWCSSMIPPQSVSIPCQRRPTKTDSPEQYTMNSVNS